MVVCVLLFAFNLGVSASEGSVSTISPANPAQNLLHALCNRQWSKNICNYVSFISSYLMHCLSSLNIYICVSIYAFSFPLLQYGVLSSSVIPLPAKLCEKCVSVR